MREKPVWWCDPRWNCLLLWSFSRFWVWKLHWDCFENLHNIFYRNLGGSFWSVLDL